MSDLNNADKAANEVTENLRGAEIINLNQFQLQYTSLEEDVAYINELFGPVVETDAEEREFELAPEEIDDATIDEMIAHLDARDRYRFGGITEFY